jgi:CheY-like chemotaxis protein
LRQPFDILLVEDNKRDAEILVELFRSIPMCHDVIRTTTKQEAIKTLQDVNKIGLIICDYYTDSLNANPSKLIAEANKNQIPFIFLTGHNSIEDSINAIKLGAVCYIQKPLTSADIVSIVTAIDFFSLEIVDTRRILNIKP